MSSDFNGFTKENMDIFFRELSKEIKKQLDRQSHIELIVVGGASVLINYEFRESTMDVDAFLSSTSTNSSIKDVVNIVGDRFGLPNGWLNADFKNTESYSPKLLTYSQYYRNYNQVLTVRSITGEYLVAMKLASLRPYKNDNSDIVGIIAEQKKIGKDISFEKVDMAVKQLYDGWERLPKESKHILMNVLNAEDIEELYSETKTNEQTNKRLLIDFEHEYAGVLTKDNLLDILNHLDLKDRDSLERFPFSSSQDSYIQKKEGEHMTVEQMTKHYIRTFKNGTKSSETRIAYDQLKQYGESLGVNLNKKFFDKLLQEMQKEPEKYLEGSEENVNQAILAQMRSYMQQVQDTGQKLDKAPVKRQGERRRPIEPI